MIGHNFKSMVKSLQGKKNIFVNSTRSLKTSLVNLREVVNRKEMLRSVPCKDEGTTGETKLCIDDVSSDKDIYPSANLKNKLFKGVKFSDLPIFNVRVSSNNTIINVTDANGVPKIINSCGKEGFKNAKKGTNIAAQATAISIGTKAIENGIKTARVRIRGLGPGRMSAIKGLQMSGLEVVSITDSTKVSWNPPRPRKQRKL